MQPTIGFIGGGRITSIFLKAWEARRMDLRGIQVSDLDPVVLEQLRAAHPDIQTSADNRLPMECSLVFLALHPPALKTVLPEAAPALQASGLVVSLAPVLTFPKLAELLGGHDRLVRMIPNAPSLISQGYNPIAYGPGVTPEDRQRLTPFLAALGKAPEVPEADLEAYAILTAMGPTYFWFQIQALRNLGRTFGLEAGAVDRSLAAMLHGATDLLLERGLPFETVNDTIPVKPLQEAQAIMTAPYAERLEPLYRKLKGR